jgi:hypothetical protein
MRVTKAVREYIEKQVRAKIEQKYEAEKNESKRIRDIKSDIENRAAEAARQAAIAIFMEAKNYEDILDCDEKFVQDIYMNGSHRVLDLKDRVYQNSVHNWSRRMHDEVEEKVQDIIVTLELGGNKADLDRMLSEL